MSKVYDVGGISVALSEADGLLFSKFLAKMNPVPDLKSMIRTDENGFIISFEPQNINWGFVFFIQNLMISQRLNVFDEFMRKQEMIK